MPRLCVVTLAGHPPTIGHRHRLLGEIAEEVPGGRILAEDCLDLATLVRRAAVIEIHKQPVNEQAGVAGKVVSRHRIAPLDSISFPSTHCRRVACKRDSRL